MSRTTQLPKSMTYREIRPYLDNNDKVLFCGKGAISKAIVIVSTIGYILNWKNWGSGFVKGLDNKYSHCGSIVRVPWQYIAELLVQGKIPAEAIDKRIDDNKADAIMLLESTSINGGFKGVQLRLLSEAIKSYKGTVTIRRQSTNMLPDLERDKNFIESVLGQRYEKSIVELFRSAIDLPGIEQDGDLSSIFCAELNALRDQLWRLLPENPPPNEYTPADYRTGGMVDENMYNGHLQEEIVIVAE